MARIAFASVLACLLLTACGGGPGIPESNYFRLPPRAAVQALPAPVFDQPVVVDTLLADGLHSSQALLYGVDAEGTQLRAYHYQLWVDPPVRMLQRRLIRHLRDAGVAPLVVDRLPAQSDAVRVTGRIDRFERLPAGEDWNVSVALALRADAPGGSAPLVVRRYAREVPVQGEGMAASVRAFGTALDAIHAEFVQDLASARAGEALPRDREAD